MPATITITDERPAARQKTAFTLDFLETHISAREFLRRRIFEEVQAHNARPTEPFNGLVTPTALETALNRAQPKPPRQIDWTVQFEKAVEMFERNGFIFLWNERQVENLDETLELTEGANATFLKLVPLVGGVL
jgi:hypothetical protein